MMMVIKLQIDGAMHQNHRLKKRVKGYNRFIRLPYNQIDQPRLFGTIIKLFHASNDRRHHQILMEGFQC